MPVNNIFNYQNHQEKKICTVNKNVSITLLMNITIWNINNFEKRKKMKINAIE